jgi:hypothetical protein
MSAQRSPSAAASAAKRTAECRCWAENLPLPLIIRLFSLPRNTFPLRWNMNCIYKNLDTQNQCPDSNGSDTYELAEA